MSKVARLPLNYRHPCVENCLIKLLIKANNTVNNVQFLTLTNRFFSEDLSVSLRAMAIDLDSSVCVYF